MSAAEDSPAILVARFLRSNNYNETLDAFLTEAGLPSSTGAATADAITIEQVLQEKQMYDLSQRFEKASIDDQDQRWSTPAPTSPHTITTLPVSSNILHVSCPLLLAPNSTTPSPFFIITTAAKTLHILSPSTPYSPAASMSALQNTVTPDAPILSTATIRNRYLLTTSMSGRLTLYDTRTQRWLGERKDHTKYVVKISVWEAPPASASPDTADNTSNGNNEATTNTVWIATAAWDAKVLLYHLVLPFQDTDEAPPPDPADRTAAAAHAARIALPLPPPCAQITLPTNPEAVLFVRHPELPASAPPVLLLSRRDSTFLYYYSLTSPDPIADAVLARNEEGNEEAESKTQECELQGKQNLAPTSNAWIAFTPAALSLHPRDGSKIAVATSHIPHMKVIVARLLFPHIDTAAQTSPSSIPSSSPTTTDPSSPPHTQQEESAHARARENAEAAAILLQTNTLAPQTAYSTPALAWRPDGTGVWVNGDDGAVRGIEVVGSGKVREILGKGGHEAGAKVRCLWGGFVCCDDGAGGRDGDGEGEMREVVVSGGFDRRVVVWTCEGE